MGKTLAEWQCAPLYCLTRLRGRRTEVFSICLTLIQLCRVRSLSLSEDRMAPERARPLHSYCEIRWMWPNSSMRTPLHRDCRVSTRSQLSFRQAALCWHGSVIWRRNARISLLSRRSRAAVSHRWIRRLKQIGYVFHLTFLWLPDPDIAVARVATRVRDGGHDIPDATVRRRYYSGLCNFFRLYRPIADHWRFYDNTGTSGPRLISTGSGTVDLEIRDLRLWTHITKGVQDREKIIEQRC